VAGIGLDSTSVNSATISGSVQLVTGNANGLPVTANYKEFTGVGRHTLVWLEYALATGTTTWYGTNNLSKCGIYGTIIS
jgi:hypothetical protein